MPVRRNGSTWVAISSHATGVMLPTMAIYRCRPQPSPVLVPLLERHPLSSQTFLALQVARWLVVVAPAGPDGSPDPAAVLAFVAGSSHGITYAAGVWHSPLIAVDQPAELAMLMWETGGSADCEFFSLQHPVRVRL